MQGPELRRIRRCHYAQRLEQGRWFSRTGRCLLRARCNEINSGSLACSNDFGCGKETSVRRRSSRCRRVAAQFAHAARTLRACPRARRVLVPRQRARRSLQGHGPWATCRVQLRNPVAYCRTTAHVRTYAPSISSVGREGLSSHATSTASHRTYHMSCPDYCTWCSSWACSQQTWCYGIIYVALPSSTSARVVISARWPAMMRWASDRLQSNSLALSASSPRSH
mmetsp:Transcript_30949/g.80864  ORF Transcript_30949/g.80864 Transcript_30949/m.80864 type:complete len:224 (-) Transcript_30949:327-998(-)